MPPTLVRVAAIAPATPSMRPIALTLHVDEREIALVVPPSGTVEVSAEMVLGSGVHRLAVEGGVGVQVRVQLDGEERLAGVTGDGRLESFFDTRDLAIPLDVPEGEYRLWSGTLVASDGEHEWRAMLTCVQERSLLSGGLLGDDHRLLVRGQIEANERGTRRVRLTALGDQINLQAIMMMERGVFDGYFLLADDTGHIVSRGHMRIPDLFLDERPKPGKQAAKPCGRLLHDSGERTGDIDYDGATAHVRFRVRRYEFCVEITYWDAVGHPIVFKLEPICTGTIGSDPNKKVHACGRREDQGKVTGLFGHPDDGTGRFSFYGRMLLFYVEGCKTAKYIQFVRTTQQYSGESATETSWGFDPKLDFSALRL